jgi:hypothetical protein
MNTTRNYISDQYYTTKEQFLVVLDSRNYTQLQNDTYNSKIRFDFKQSLMLPRDALNITCSVLSFTAPNSLYNINEYNNFIHLQYLSKTTPVVSNDISFKIPIGNYTSKTFMTKLTALMQIYGGGVSPTFASGFSISIDDLTNQFTMINSIYSFSFMADSTIDSVMGFLPNQTTNSLGVLGSSNQKLESPFTCNFNGYQNVNIHLDSFNTSNVDSFSKSRSSIVASIPIDSNDSNIFFLKQNDFAFSLKDNVIDYIIISIKDDVGNYVNWNNQNWNLSLCFSITKDIDRFAYENSFYDILKRGYS